MEEVILQTDIKEFPLFAKGKVRDVYDLQDKLLIIATDRISAFDYVLPEGIPGKGKVLTQLSSFFFDLVKDIVPNHLISGEVEDFPKELHRYREILEGRSMLVKKAQRVDIECVVRGYISGSLWKEYRGKKEKSGGEVFLLGFSFPSDLVESQKLAEPIFTPSTKSETGHDENISFEKMENLVGEKLAKKLEEKSLQIYKKASDYAEKKGIIIADTKFEFGILNQEIILIDEIFSPDSSRFWSKKDYKPGEPQDSFDKQYVRNYLEKIKWDKKPPAPQLSKDVIENTSKKYMQAYEILTGEKFLRTN